MLRTVGGARASAMSSYGSAAESIADASRPDRKSAVSKHEERNAKENRSGARVMPQPLLLRGYADNLT